MTSYDYNYRIAPIAYAARASRCLLDSTEGVAKATDIAKVEPLL